MLKDRGSIVYMSCNNDEDDGELQDVYIAGNLSSNNSMEKRKMMNGLSVPLETCCM
jgi:hypothetical protein